MHYLRQCGNVFLYVALLLVVCSKCALKCYLKKGCSAPARRLLDEGLNEQLDGAIVTVFQAKCCLLDGEMDKAQQVHTFLLI